MPLWLSMAARAAATPGEAPCECFLPREPVEAAHLLMNPALRAQALQLHGRVGGQIARATSGR